MFAAFNGLKTFGFILLLALACDTGLQPPCETSADCEDGFECVAGECKAQKEDKEKEQEEESTEDAGFQEVPETTDAGGAGVPPAQDAGGPA